MALIRLRFVELGFRQIKRKYIQYNTIEYSTSRNIAESNNTRVYASIKATNSKEGHIKVINSDNAKTFKKASKWIKKVYKDERMQVPRDRGASKAMLI